MDLNLRNKFKWRKKVCTKLIAWLPNVFEQDGIYGMKPLYTGRMQKHVWIGEWNFWLCSELQSKKIQQIRVNICSVRYKKRFEKQKSHKKREKLYRKYKQLKKNHMIKIH